MSEPEAKPSCSETNRAGYPCKNPVILPSGRCVVHDAESALHAQFMPGDEHTKGPGRPRKLAAPEVLREMVERELEVWLAPYREAVTSAIVTATFNGEVIPSDIADLGARIAAAEKVLDRVYGRPKQSVDQTIEAGESLAALLAPTPLASTDTPLPEAWEGTDG